MKDSKKTDNREEKSRARYLALAAMKRRHLTALLRLTRLLLAYQFKAADYDALEMVASRSFQKGHDVARSIRTLGGVEDNHVGRGVA